MKRFISACLLATTLTAPMQAQAGSSANGVAILPADQVASFANRVQQDLAARGARVAIVARVGRDPAQLPDDVTYTHVGIWVYSRITLADGSTGQGYRVYNLYQQADNPVRSDLVQDSPADFFAGAHVFDAGIIIPDPRLQTKLLDVIGSPTYSALHNPVYSALSNPNTNRFQNCTEHTLNVLMAALYDTDDLNQIKANTAAYFVPQPIAVNGLQRAFATVASQALTTADHGPNVATATFGSIARFMENNDLAAEVYRITPTSVVRF
ncbi:hypothetical protein SAMN04488005_0014 [Yoonia tamlensis]|uniref:DUF2145 domain-containing protein n=1 Tax=Yoonia tamlensis TaxID=390270 RepID=A0A1I6FNL6_9RHOB|nr:DUF2145 domain-containing protein [Yoonia tamlensis]SFR31387.1 hypothetical protein SAMN04488005_0014 [Yoonia tamlensis]